MLKLPFVCPVVGISNYQHAAGRVAVGDRVRVEHEPDNPYDTLAVAVRLAGGELVGYVPRALAARLAERKTGSLRGEITDVLTGHDTIGLRVRVLDRDAATENNDRTTAAVGADAPDDVVTTRGTGRMLGTFVRHDEATRRVVVLARGAEISYPSGLVEVRSAALSGHGN